VQRRLDLLDAGDPVTDVRAAFSWSCQRLGAAAGRMFRLLGAAHPGPDISAAAAASLAGVPLRQARRALAELTTARLLSEYPADRFSFHDLLREYAAEQGRAADSAAERGAALRRVLDHYVHTSYRAALLLSPQRSPITLAAPEPGAVPEDLVDDARALDWLEDEYPVLLAVIALAAESGFHAHAWQIPWSLTDFLPRRGHFQSYVATQDIALAAARQLGDLSAQALAHRELGHAHGLLGRYPDAGTHFRCALDLYRQLGDHRMQVILGIDLAQLALWQDRPAEARDYARRALALAQAMGHLPSSGSAFNTIGWASALLGDYQEALASCEQALDIIIGLDDSHARAATLDSLGYIHHQLGNHSRALDCYRQAVHLYESAGERRRQAVTLDRLGDTHRAADNTEAARECWEQALVILTDLGDPAADAVRSKLGRP
jgi:tetratricopeptide (TPR) repeat protein